MSEHKDHADVKIHPPILTLIFLMIAYLAKRFVPLPFDTPTWLQPLGIFFILSGCFLALAAIREFIKAKTTINPHGSVSNIISSGIFGLTRNPIYLGFVSILIGVPLYFNTYWGIILAPVLIMCFNYFVIQHEEAYLEKKFGEQYASYKSRVRRWL